MKTYVRYLEIHLADECNLKCANCTHFSNLSPEKHITIEDFESQIKVIANNFELRKLRLLGGEPLLHPQLAELVQIARKYLPDTDIHIVSNGLLLHTLSDETLDAISKNDVLVWVSKYPVKLRYSQIIERCEKHKVKISLPDENRKLFWAKHPLNLKGDSNPDKEFEICRIAHAKCWILNDRKIFPCAYPAFIDIFNERFGQNLQVCEDDYVSIDSPTLQTDIEKLLKPIPFCRFCKMECTEDVKYQHSRFDIKEYI